MSKHHQASRRRAYGRRQHEVRERIDRLGRQPEDPRDAREEALVLDEPSRGSLRWVAVAWGGLN